MQVVSSESDQRILFFDNLRYFLVLLVVGFHSVVSFSYAATWWPVDDNYSIISDHILVILDIFMMPGLFFIAGYFAVFSHEKKTTLQFIKGKLKRLGIPWLIGVVLLNPVQLYIYTHSRGDRTMGMAQCFVHKMKSMLSFCTGKIEAYDQFNQMHLWFISLLLLFFILFAIGRKAKHAMASKTARIQTVKPSSPIEIIGILFFAGILIFFLNMTILRLFPSAVGANSWFTLANLIQFQTDRLAINFVCFILGVYSYHKKWFSTLEVPGHMLLWAVLSAALFYAISVLSFSLLEEFNRIKGLLYLLLSPFCVFSMLMLLISFGVKYWNGSSKVNRFLSDSSYGVYLIHLGVVWLFQWIMLAWFKWPVPAKAFWVYGSSVFISLIISHYALKKSPAVSSVGLVSLFVLLTVLLK